MTEELNQFLIELDEEVANVSEDYSNRTDAFTSVVLSEIAELINIDEYQIFHGVNKDMANRVKGELYGYAMSANGEVLTLFYTIYDNSLRHEVMNLPAQEYQQALNRLQGFYDAAIRGLHYDISEKDPLYEPAKLIDENKHDIKTVRLCIISNYNIKDADIKKVRITDKEAYPDLWDIKKLYQFHKDGIDHVPIDIDFESEYKNYKLPYIEMNSEENGYKCILTMFPAKLLYHLYDKHNTGLLLNNIRYFLGFTGSKKNNANIGILDTLRQEKHRFLAYNNGITALAKDIIGFEEGNKTDIETIANSDVKISSDYIKYGILRRIHDFQIVNGGQTTASIFYAKNKGIALNGAYVQVKIVVLDSNVNDMAENITRYSNTQSRIKYSDFTVSNAFNMEMERLSRTIVIPSVKNSTKHWYFERLRGQYDVEKKKNSNSRATRDYFNSLYPNEKRFKKELIAKVWQSWDQEPYNAVKGEATNYDLFMAKIQKINFLPSEIYFRETIALIIIYNYLMNCPYSKEWKNKKATIVAYTIALLKYLNFDRFDLIKVWNEQCVGTNLKPYLHSLSAQVENSLTDLAEKGQTSVLSVGKKKSTYDDIRDQGFRVSNNLLIDYLKPKKEEDERNYGLFEDVDE